MNKSSQLAKLLSDGNFIDFQLELENSFSRKIISKDIYYKLQGLKFFYIQNYKEAAEFFKKSLDIDNNKYDTHLNLAICLTYLNDSNESEVHYKKSIVLNPKFNDIYIHFSRSLRKFNKDKDAIKILKKGIENNKKDSFPITFEIANAYRENYDYELAINYYSKIIQLNPDNYIVLNSIAVCYEFLGKNDQAEKYFKKTIQINPSYFEGLANYGNFLRSLGKSDEALSVLDKCLKLKGNKSELFRFISILRSFSSNKDKYLQKMLDFLQSDEFKKDVQKHQLYFALSKAYEDIGDVKNFTKFVTLANKNKRENISNEKVLADFNIFKIDTLFNEETINKNPPQLKGSDIILILGMPRSGTTLVEQILGSHVNVSAGGEQLFFQDILRSNFEFSNFDNFKKKFQSQYSDIKDKIGNDYFQKIISLNNNNKIVTDKLPFNFLYIGFFLTIFQNIKIIHVERDPIDNCFSIYKNFFTSNINFAYEQKELADYYNLYQKMMSHWNDLFKDKIYNLKYENLISNSDKEIKNLINYCNLEWDPKCLDFYKSKSAVKTLSTIQVRKPIYKSSIKSWKKYEKSIKDLINHLD